VAKSKLLDRVRSQVKPQGSWYFRLSPQQQAEVEEVVAALVAGDINTSLLSIARSIKEEFQLPTALRTICTYLHEAIHASKTA
jgi:hypothetical protein